MGFIKEFKDFASKGNVVDLAVGIVIGSAFGKIVSSAVNDIIMPPVGLLIGGVNFTDIKLKMKEAVTDETGKVISEAVTLNIGNFIQAVFDFIIIAFAVFLVVKVMNNLRKKEAAAAPIPSISNEEKLLAEIRDILKEPKPSEPK